MSFFQQYNTGQSLLCAYWGYLFVSVSYISIWMSQPFMTLVGENFSKKRCVRGWEVGLGCEVDGL